MRPTISSNRSTTNPSKLPTLRLQKRDIFYDQLTTKAHSPIPPHCVILLRQIFALVEIHVLRRRPSRRNVHHQLGSHSRIFHPLSHEWFRVLAILDTRNSRHQRGAFQLPFRRDGTPRILQRRPLGLSLHGIGLPQSPDGPLNISSNLTRNKLPGHGPSTTLSKLLAAVHAMDRDFMQLTILLFMSSASM